MSQQFIMNQTVAVLVDGNNIERSILSESNNTASMLNFETLIPKILRNRSLNRFVYFREGQNISSKLAERLHDLYHGSVRPCHKSADIPLSITATQIASKVDTIVILSGDSDYVELVRHLKSQGVRVEIAAVRSTTAGVLIEEADYFLPITQDDWFVYKGADAAPPRVVATPAMQAEMHREPPQAPRAVPNPSREPARNLDEGRNSGGNRNANRNGPGNTPRGGRPALAAVPNPTPRQPAPSRSGNKPQTTPEPPSNKPSGRRRR